MESKFKVSNILLIVFLVIILITGCKQNKDLFSVKTKVITGQGSINLSSSQEKYKKGSQLQIEAVAKPGYEFEEWTGSLSGSNPKKSVVVNNDLTVGAKFAMKQSNIDSLFSSQDKSYKVNLNIGEKIDTSFKNQIFSKKQLKLSYQSIDSFIKSLLKNDKITSKEAAILSSYKPGYIIKRKGRENLEKQLFNENYAFDNNNLFLISENKKGTVNLKNNKAYFLDASSFKDDNNRIFQVQELKIYNPKINQNITLINTGKSILVFQKIASNRIYLGNIEIKEILGFTPESLEFVEGSYLSYTRNNVTKRVKYNLKLEELEDEIIEENWGAAKSQTSEIKLFKEENFLYNQAKENNFSPKYSFEYLRSYPNGKVSSLVKTKLNNKYGIENKDNVYLKDNKYIAVQAGKLNKQSVNGFWMDKYEVTHKEYLEFLNSVEVSPEGKYKGKEIIILNPVSFGKRYGYCAIKYNGDKFHFEDTKRVDNKECPVVWVNWYGAVAYANWLSKKEGLNPAYDLNKWELKGKPKNLEGYRLPTETEWEYAARGGIYRTKTVYAGSNNIDEVAWYKANSKGETHPVGKKEANELGIYDMSGNVWEWTNTLKGSKRVIRGGSWYSKAKYRPKISGRHKEKHYSASSLIGFRMIRTIK